MMIQDIHQIWSSKTQNLKFSFFFDNFVLEYDNVLVRARLLESCLWIISCLDFRDQFKKSSISCISEGCQHFSTPKFRIQDIDQIWDNDQIWSSKIPNLKFLTRISTLAVPNKNVVPAERSKTILDVAPEYSLVLWITGRYRQSTNAFVFWAMPTFFDPQI